jgi:SnoaL-like domain
MDAETVDYVAISRLQAAYADVVSRRAWPELVELFLPDARVRVDTVTAEPVELDGPQRLGEFISGAIERFGFFQFVILNARVTLGTDDDADRARGRMFISEVRQDRASGEWSRTHGVYHDEYRCVDGRWRFAQRDYQSLARTGSDRSFDFPDGYDL